MFAVAGTVTDAQSAYLKLAGAKITVKNNITGEEVANTVTNGAGNYEVKIPGGIMRFTAEKDGYIQYSKVLTISSVIQIGQQGHMPMAKVVPPGSYIITLEWGRADTHACDLDSFVYFGAGESSKVFWGNLRTTAPGTG